ncbi:unnamed protein product [Effrenium voratum]|uniref:Peptidylprolyl isomerase n=1 Tax=Effrenium voratum TaxID=2562239 RepID=A0AA36ITV9_9DINO|nr:unnamed protein product [Effrenium voratum]
MARRALRFALLTWLLGACWIHVPGDRHRPRTPKVVRQSRPTGAISDQCYLVKESPALSKSELHERLALRKPLPERLALVPSHQGAPQDARLLNFNAAGQTVEVSLFDCGTVQMLEKHSSLWRVLLSDCDAVLPGTLVQIYDTTPRVEAPESADVAGGVKTTVLQESESARAAVTWNGMNGFSPSNCPREADGVHVAWRLWNCAQGACSLLHEEEDDKALVCEFGSLKKGILTMVVGETRRFWIPWDAPDRRFGRPVPERALPAGDLVVDLTVLGIEREAVFDYKLSEETLKLVNARERSLPVLASRAVGVGIQVFAWAMVYLHYLPPQEGSQVCQPDAQFHPLKCPCSRDSEGDTGFKKPCDLLDWSQKHV